MNSLPNKTLSFRLLLQSLIDYDRTFTLEGFMKPKKQIIPEKRSHEAFMKPKNQIILENGSHEWFPSLFPPQYTT
jgi:hypothetical protein